jgi:excisionase family DNA binding protein
MSRRAAKKPVIIGPRKARAMMSDWRELFTGSGKSRRRAGRGHLTVAQAAVWLSASEKTVRQLMKDRELPFIDIGSGKVRAAPRIKIEDLEQFEEKRRGQKKWPSTKEAKSTITSSSTEVIDFAALRAARRSAKPEKSSGNRKRKSRKRATVVKL